ncbi:hypothetical protein GWK26_09045 [haloarchaeon 3A1-DGR]|nr:hypothetical protein GWK26_09045 [haloarchaeon 3A1-DGR]
MPIVNLVLFDVGSILRCACSVRLDPSEIATDNDLLKSGPCLISDEMVSELVRSKSPAIESESIESSIILNELLSIELPEDESGVSSSPFKFGF